MTRGKRSKYVKKITGREKKLFTQLAKTGLTDKNQARIFCEINHERLKRLENSKYIKRTNYCVDGKNTEIIRLGNKGKKYCKDELNIKSFAVAQTNHLTHDLKVSLSYYSLPNSVQETWEHEREILNDIYSKNHSLVKGDLKTCIDARVTVNGVKIAIEIIGSSYNKEDITLKEDIALNYAGCSSIEFIK